MAMHDFMKDRGYEFVEQMGSGYFFKSRRGKAPWLFIILLAIIILFGLLPKIAVPNNRLLYLK
jgi:hypothetical protein